MVAEIQTGGEPSRNGERHGFQVVQTIHVPARVYDWKAHAATRQRAKEIQDRNRSQFLAAFADGICAPGYERHPEGNGRFLLGTWDENWLCEAYLPVSLRPVPKVPRP